MRYLLTILLFMCSVAQGQEFKLSETGLIPSSYFEHFDCGEWKTKTDTSEWVAVDTLNIIMRNDMRKNKIKVYPAYWVYDRIKSTDPNVIGVTDEYNPCKGTQSNYEQYRIDRIVGIRQRRTIVHRGYYEKSLSEYEREVQKFTQNQTQ